MTNRMFQNLPPSPHGKAVRHNCRCGNSDSAYEGKLPRKWTKVEGVGEFCGRYECREYAEEAKKNLKATDDLYQMLRAG